MEFVLLIWNPQFVMLLKQQKPNKDAHGIIVPISVEQDNVAIILRQH